MYIEYYSTSLDYLPYCNDYRQFESLREMIEYIAEKKHVSKTDITLQLQDDCQCKQSFKILFRNGSHPSCCCRVYK